MPFWRRPAPPPREATPEELAAELGARPGTDPCSERGCTAMTGLACEYVDRRDRRCRTAWCPAHRMVVDLHVYCRRHAGVVSALPTDTALTIPLPDLENRAPSLVGWMARQIDADVWRLMLRELDAAAGGQLIADPVTLVFVGLERHRAWERTWKLVTHEGDKRRVSLVVEEDTDHEVTVKVGANPVDRAVPPWITHRLRHETVDAEQDAQERRDFNERLVAAVERGLARERELSYAIERDAGAPVLHVTDAAGTGDA